ncbi:cleavage and polyadenylation specificity factor subunit 3-I [Pelomyxa schiedti]|nr:cleavage and polyadenylation specificity factor subunit 3-I [Pelomyxa schiedti]
MQGAPVGDGGGVPGGVAVTSLRKRKEPAPPDDQLEIMPLGAGNEVGRSCVLLKYKGKSVLFDCGVHPAFSGESSLPFFDAIDPGTVDLVLISHFHLDHCAALPYFLEKTTFRGRAYMTYPTNSIYKLLLSDFVRKSNSPADEMLYTEQDLLHSMERIERIDYHEELEHNGIKFKCLNAGHVLGAAMFLVEIAGVRVLYTGDFSRQEDRHLMGAEAPSVSVDVLIVESTYGVQTHQPREEREKLFTGYVHEIVTRGGRCLIPVFALGRAQELLLILDEFWDEHPELHSIPVYFASTLAKKCMTFYQAFVNMMNEHIRNKFAISNPFRFKYVAELDNEVFDDNNPCVVMASPGMLQNGLSRTLFEKWCSDKKSGVILPGYCVEGTLAKKLLTGEPKTIPSGTHPGVELARNCSIKYISFSAHSDFKQTSEFIDILFPSYVVLVHGDGNEMGRLKQALTQIYEKKSMEVLMPGNTQVVSLQFHGDKIAKAIGKLASEPPSQRRRLSGVIVRKDFMHRLLDPSELHTYTQLRTNQVMQHMTIPFHSDLGPLVQCLQQVFSDTTGYDASNSACVVRVHGGAVELSMQSPGVLLLDWNSTPLSDMISDAIISIVMNIEMNPVAASALLPAVKPEASAPPAKPKVDASCVVGILTKHFGGAEVDPTKEGYVNVNCDGEAATICLADMTVSSSSEVLQSRVEGVLVWLRETLLPID